MNTEKNEVAAITGTTESGFRYTLPPDALDDYELLENLCDIDNGDASKIMETDQRSTSCCTGLCEDTANGSRLEPVDSRNTSGDRKKATFSRLHWSFLFYFL